MRKTTAIQLAGIATLVLVAIALASPRPNKPLSPPKQDAAARVDLVIALDTSSSMDGLIDSARQKMWDVVNLLGRAQPKPVLRVGVIQFGNSGLDAATGWVRKESDLTTDLDGVYAKLFALRTNGGEEYVARALDEATARMEWDQSPGTLRMVFVAGNEPANQDPRIPLQAAVARAREKGIFVNTIYCGAETAVESSLWRQVATLGRGRYAAIDQNSAVAIATPMDDELARLSVELNGTYVGYGARGGEGMLNQAAQDTNAASVAKPVAAARAVAKSSSLYDNAGWDLVDAKKKGKDVAAMPAEALPEPMRAMNAEERRAYVDGKEKERAEIQKKIATLAAKREEHLKAARKAGPGKALDDALSTAIREQARSAGMAVE